MQTSSLRRQDGFIREILWVALVLGVIALVALDGMALFGAHQSAHDVASQAAGEARNAFAETQSVAAAKAAALQAVEKNGDVMVDFGTTTGFGGEQAFVVTVKGHTDTYAFKYLRYIPGLKGWVKTVSNPVAEEPSS